MDRSAQRLQPLLDLGAQAAATPQALAAGVDIVISIVTDEAALEAVYFGSAGLLAAPLASRLFIDMSTVAPAWQQSMGAGVPRRCWRCCAAASSTWVSWAPARA